MARSITLEKNDRTTVTNYGAQNFKDVTTKSKSKFEMKKFGLSWLSKIMDAVKPEKSRAIPNVVVSDKNLCRAISTSDVSNEYYNTIALSEQTPSKKAVRENQCKYSTSSTYEKDIVPLRQYLRYSIDHSDRRTYQRRRVTRPFQPKYEIEWQKNQWLQLDDETNKEIERLRKTGFSKVAIRKDTNLKKYIMYENASDIDVLLELSLNKDFVEHTVGSQPISCHQPTRFCVRRSYWWHNSYKIGEASLPDWVDPDLCCNGIVMDASSVMAAMTNISRSSLSSTANNNTDSRFPDTPAPSKKSSLNHLNSTSLTWPIKPLKYVEPPSVLEIHSLPSTTMVR